MGGVSLTAQFIYHYTSGKDILITYTHPDETKRKNDEIRDRDAKRGRCKETEKERVTEGRRDKTERRRTERERWRCVFVRRDN